MTQDQKNAGNKPLQKNYDWNFTGRIMTVDNGARFSDHTNFRHWMTLDAFSVVCFDPLNTLEARDLNTIEEFQIIPNITLGNDGRVTRYDCLNPKTSATLKPLESTLASTFATDDKVSGPNFLLIEHPIRSAALDNIHSLNRLEWLLLDDKNDNSSIIQYSTEFLKQALLVDIQVPFSFTHENQTDFASINQLMIERGFRFFRFHNASYHSDLPEDFYLEKNQASELLYASAIFIPTNERLNLFSKNSLLKLGFLLYTVYQLKDTAYKILNLVDNQLAINYLYAEGFKWKVDEDETEFTLTEEYSPDIWANKFEE